MTEPLYFDSQEQAAATLGVSIFDLRQAKREGCQAFRRGRVYREPVLAWLADRPAAGAAAKDSPAKSLEDLISDFDLAKARIFYRVAEFPAAARSQVEPIIKRLSADVRKLYELAEVPTAAERGDDE